MDRRAVDRARGLDARPHCVEAARRSALTRRAARVRDPLGRARPRSLRGRDRAGALRARDQPVLGSAVRAGCRRDAGQGCSPVARRRGDPGRNAAARCHLLVDALGALGGWPTPSATPTPAWRSPRSRWLPSASSPAQRLSARVPSWPTFSAPVSVASPNRLASRSTSPQAPAELPPSPPMASDLSRVKRCGRRVAVSRVVRRGDLRPAGFRRSVCTQPRARSTAAIQTTGRAVVSAFVGSPTFGGSSWLAHISLHVGRRGPRPRT